MSGDSAVYVIDGSDSTAVGETTASRLCGDDLGRFVALVHEGVLVMGALTSVDHTTGYSKREPTRCYVAVKSESWRWAKHISPATVITFHLPVLAP